MIVRRILGIIMLLTGLIILLASLVGMYYTGSVLNNLAGGLKNSLMLSTQSLQAARNTLDFTLNTLDGIGTGIDAAVDATGSAAVALSDSRPLVENVSGVVTQEIPEAVEGIQGTLPNIIQVAAVIDNTLETLSGIGIDREIPLPFGGSIPLRFDLGIEYDPEVPFDESLRSFQTSLDGLPESLRGLETDLGQTAENFTILSTDLQLASDNLAGISEQFGAIEPLITQYTRLIDQLDGSIAGIEADIDQQIMVLRYGIMTVLVFLGLAQLAPIYLGWELLTGRRNNQSPMALVPIPSSVPELAEVSGPMAEKMATDDRDMLADLPAAEKRLGVTDA